MAWMRELRLVFGATTAATAAVLAIFMGGLGLGSAVLGRRADQARNPLLFYGILETAVALSVAATPSLITLTRRLYYALGGQITLHMTGATAVRLVLAVAVLGLPTFLMGGTLPAAVRFVTRNADTRRLALAVLYGANTLGAVCGVAVATFYALELVGTQATLWAACALNLSIGALAMLRARDLPPLAADAPRMPSQANGGESHLTEALLTSRMPSVSGSISYRVDPVLVYATAAILGFTFFTMELVWFRMLAPILGGTTFTFGLILCVALFGIGVGGAAYNVMFRWLRPTWAILALSCAAEAACAALPYALGDRVALWAGHLEMGSTTFGGVVVAWCYVASVVVLPPALVSGLQFPLLIALLGQGRAGVSRQLGTTYAWNTVGAIMGSLVAGFGILPLLSAPGTWQAVVVILAALSACLLARAGRSCGRFGVAAGALACFAVLCLFQIGPTAAWRHSGIGAGRGAIPEPDPNSERFWLHENRSKFVWQAEGIESSIGIIATDGLSFVVNGKVDGSAIGDAATQVGLAIVGAALHPDPKTALVIGLGTGQTAGWLAEMRDIEHVDVAELEPAVDQMAQMCRSVNHDVLHHPNVRRIYCDGRELVFTTDAKYDLVCSEPSNPFRAGMATLYTEEFYRGVQDRLNEDGLFLQWLQAYEVDEAAIETVLATVRAVFPHVEVWQTLPSDLLLVCANKPIEVRVEDLRRRIGEGTLRDALHLAWNVDDLEGFLAHYAAGPGFTDDIHRSSILRHNTDDLTVLEYGFAKTVGRGVRISTEYLRRSAVIGGWHRPQLRGDTSSVDWYLVEVRRQEFNLLLNGELSIAADADARLQKLVMAFQQHQNGHYEQALRIWPDDSLEVMSDIGRLALAHCYAEVGRDECLKVLDTLEHGYPVDVAAGRAIYYWRANRISDAVTAMEQLCQRLRENPWFLTELPTIALDLTHQCVGDDQQARQRLFDALEQPFAVYRMEPQRRVVRYLLAENLGTSQAIEALAAMEPNVPWVASVLKARARFYAAAKHPLARQAEQDWLEFQRYDNQSMFKQ
jgi:spermidine synthase